MSNTSKIISKLHKKTDVKSVLLSRGIKVDLGEWQNLREKWEELMYTKQKQRGGDDYRDQIQTLSKELEKIGTTAGKILPIVEEVIAGAIELGLDAPDDLIKKKEETEKMSGLFSDGQSMFSNLIM